MTKVTYKLTTGLAHIITTGEPVFIKDFTANDAYASVVRPVVTQNGIEYREEAFPVDQLESPFAQVKRKLEFDEFVRDLQEKLQNKRYELSRATKEALKHQAPNPSQKLFKFNGDGDING